MQMQISLVAERSVSMCAGGIDNIFDVGVAGACLQNAEVWPAYQVPAFICPQSPPLASGRGKGKASLEGMFPPKSSTAFLIKKYAKIVRWGQWEGNAVPVALSGSKKLGLALVIGGNSATFLLFFKKQNNLLAVGPVPLTRNVFRLHLL